MRRPAAALILIASLLSFLMACPILAGPIEDSVKAYRRGDYKTAYQLAKPQAEKGDADAQFILGYLYDEGKGVPQDYTEAAKWYGRAAKQGNKAARHNLGLINDQGQVSKDRAEMGKWHRGAAEPGNAAARSNLGLKDKQVRGVPRDNPELEKWHRGAAETGNAAARSNLGFIDDQGQVSKDRAEVGKWHRGAAEPEIVAARSNLGLKDKQVRGVPKDNPKLGKWHRGAAEPENVAARSNLGLKEKQVRGVPRDNPELEKWHRGAAEPENVSRPIQTRSQGETSPRCSEGQPRDGEVASRGGRTGKRRRPVQLRSYG